MGNILTSVSENEMTEVSELPYNGKHDHCESVYQTWQKREMARGNCTPEGIRVCHRVKEHLLYSKRQSLLPSDKRAERRGAPHHSLTRVVRRGSSLRPLLRGAMMIDARFM